jgi:cell division protein ZapA (FtsZ GTPase activity inhibitor)
MSSLKITVKIADREYRLNIHREKEEVIRNVAEKINESLKKYAENFEFKDKQDLLAMVVLQNAIRNSELEQEVEFQQKQLTGKLEEIDRVLSEKLST